MQLKSAIKRFLDSKSDLKGYSTYKSCARYLNVTVNLKTIDLSGDLLTSEKKKRIRKTKILFEKVEQNLKGKSQNTKFFTINMLKSILLMVEEEEGSRFWTAYKVKQEVKDVVILDLDFAKGFVIDSHKLYDNLSVKLKAVWELSAVMLTTSLRFSDAQGLTVDDVKNSRVTIKNRKTGTVTSCPIPYSLYNKLQENANNQGSIYSKNLSKDASYRLLPKLFALYPEMTGKTNLKFHVFRKTAISVMLAFGIPESIVKKASGHSANSKAFARYVGFVETMFDEKINDFQNKFYH